MKRRVTVLVALVVLASVAAAAPAATASDASEQSVVTIEIQVVTDDGDPVGNAEVTVEYDDTTKSGTTRANGKILFDVAEGANVRASVTHPDYVKNHPETFKSVDGETAVSMTMYPRATATIEVSDAQGPVSGATVTVRKVTGPRVVVEGETGEDGTFETGPIERGEYVVSVLEDGYLKTSERMTALNNRIKNVEIEQAKTRLTVQVFDSHFDPAEPVSDVSVRVTDSEGTLATLTTRNSNTAEIPLDVNTEYTVIINKSRYGESSKRISLGESPQSVRFNVTREPSLSISPETDNAKVGQSVRVTVTNEYGNPVEGATVYANDEAVGQTLSDGTQSVAVASEGTIELRAETDEATSGTVTVEGFVGATPTPTPTPTATATATGTATVTASATQPPTTTESDGGALPGFSVIVALAGLAAGLLALRRR